MTRFLATTATALILGTAAFANGHTSVFSDMQFDSKSNVKASDLIGARVYATKADLTNMVVAEDGEKDWDDIGEINEIVLTRAGNVSTVILGVGGFLGMGEKDVAIDMSQLKFVSDGEDADAYFLVVNADAAGVEAAPSYSMFHQQGEMERPMMAAPMVKRDGYQNVMSKDLTTEDLTGARVYGPNDEDVGEISALLVTTQGKLDRAVIDVGGFLGMGERPVAVTMQELQIVRKEEGDELRVYIDSSEDTLKKLPEYQS